MAIVPDLSRNNLWLDGHIPTRKRKLGPAALALLGYTNFDPISFPTLAAEAAISLDVTTGKLLAAKNLNYSSQPASLTKVNTAVWANTYVNWNATITVHPDDADVYRFVASEGWVLKDVLDGMMLPSNNAACNILARAVAAILRPDLTDTTAIRTWAAGQASTNANVAIGMTNSYFADLHGLSSASRSTVGDLAKLGRYVLLNVPVVAASWAKSTSTVSITGGNPNPRSGVFRHALDFLEAGNMPEVAGGKTGWTTAADRTLLWAQLISGHLVIHAFLRSPDDVNRYLDALTMMDAVKLNYAWSGTQPILSSSGKFAPSTAFNFVPAATAAPGGENGEDQADEDYNGVLLDGGEWYRSSVATYFDVNGTLVDAAPNIPRADYRPQLHGLRGRLFEPARTNGVINGILKGAVASNGIELSPNWNSWLFDQTQAGATAAIVNNALELTGTGTLTARADFQVTGATPGHRFVINFPSGVLNNTAGLNVGAARGGAELLSQTMTASATAKDYNIVVPAGGTFWIRLFRTAAGTATIPLRSVMHAGRFADGHNLLNVAGLAWFVTQGPHLYQGLNAIRVRIRGTPTASGTGQLDLGANNTAASACAVGEEWVHSFIAQRIGGSASNFSLSQRVAEYDAGGIAIAPTAQASGSFDSIANPATIAASQRSSFPKVITDTTAAFTRTAILFTVTSGAAVDIELLIANPQTERYKSASGVVDRYAGRTAIIRSDPDDSSTWTRAADSWIITNLKAGNYEQHFSGGTIDGVHGISYPIEQIVVPPGGRYNFAYGPAVTAERHLHHLLFRPLDH